MDARHIGGTGPLSYSARSHRAACAVPNCYRRPLFAVILGSIFPSPLSFPRPPMRCLYRTNCSLMHGEDFAEGVLRQRNMMIFSVAGAASVASAHLRH